jgi:hypothetical protein
MINRLAVIILLFFSASLLTAQNNHTGQEVNPDSSMRPYLIAIVVQNVENTAAWYKEKLNFEIIKKLDFPEYDSLKIIAMKYGETELELIQKKTSFSINKFVPDYNGFSDAPLRGFAKIAFWVHNIDKLAARLKLMNVKFYRNLYDDKSFGVRSFIIEDIDGNSLQFNQKLK